MNSTDQYFNLDPKDHFQSQIPLNPILKEQTSSPIPQSITPKYETTTTPKPIQAQLLAAPSFDFQVEESKIKDYIDLAVSLNPEQTGVIQEKLTQLVPGLIEDIIKQGLIEPENTSSSLTAINKPETILEGLDLSEPTSPFLFQECYIKRSPKLEIAVVGINILSRGSSVIALGMLLNKIQDALTAKKKFLESVIDENERNILQNEIDLITKWLEMHTASFSRLLRDNIIDTTFSLPKASAAIISLVKAGSTLLGTLIGWIGMGVSVIGYAFDWNNKQKNLDKHEMWTKVINNDRQAASQIFDRQQKIFEERLKLNEPVRDRLLKAIHDDLEAAKAAVPAEKERVLNESLMKLKDVGIELPEGPLTLEALQAALLNPADLAAINVMMVKKKEALSVSLRNGLKALNQKKTEMDRGFLKNALDKSSGFFILYTYITGWTIALESLLATSAITSAVVLGFCTAFLTVLGYGTLAGLVISVTLGSIYLYLKKPNIFKTYIQGVQAKLVFWNIPLSIQRFRKNCALLEKIKVSEEIHQLGIKILQMDHRILQEERNQKAASYHPHKGASNYYGLVGLSNCRNDMEETRKQKEKEYDSLINKVTALNESISGFEERVKPLQDRIEQAGWNDFQDYLRKGREIELPESKNKSNEAFRVLAEYLLKDPTLLEDSETQKVLLQMGIDLDKLSDIDQNASVDKVSNKIRAFFAMEVEDKMKIVKDNL